MLLRFDFSYVDDKKAEYQVLPSEHYTSCSPMCIFQNNSRHGFVLIIFAFFLFLRRDFFLGGELFGVFFINLRPLF